MSQELQLLRCIRRMGVLAAVMAGASIPVLGVAPWLSGMDYSRTTIKKSDTDTQDADLNPRTDPRAVTPHSFEVRPYYKGRIKALVFVLAKDTRPREIAELAERYDIDVDFVYVTLTWGGYGGSRTVQIYKKYSSFSKKEGVGPGEERLNRLLNEPYDVYVFADVLTGNWPPGFAYTYSLLSEEQWGKIIARVRNGAGILCTGGSPDSFPVPGVERETPAPACLSNGTVLACLPDRSGVLAQMQKQGLPIDDSSVSDNLVSAYRIGEGRGVQVQYPIRSQINSLLPWLPYDYGVQIEYDHWMAWLGKCVQWAAHRECDVEPRFTSDDISFDRSQLPGSISFSLAGGLSRSPALNLQAKVTNRRGHVWELPAVPIAQQTASVSLNIPRLPVGDYFADIVLYGDAGVLGIWSKDFSVRDRARIEEVLVRDVEVSPGGRVEGRLRLSNVFDRPGRRLYLYVRDGFGRDLAREQLELPASQDAALVYGHGWQRRLWQADQEGKADQFEELPFSIRIPDDATISMRLIAVLDEDGQVADEKHINFNVPPKYDKRFRFIGWDPPADYLGYYDFRLNAQVWSNAAVTQGGRASGVAAFCNVPAIRYTTRITERCNSNGMFTGSSLESPDPKSLLSWNDDAAVDKHVRTLARLYTCLKREGVLAYSLGDEGTVRGADLSPHTLRAYQDYLKKQYGSIAALNQSWDTTYRDFSEVRLLTFDDVMNNYGTIDSLNRAKGTSFKTFDEAKNSYIAAWGARPEDKRMADMYEEWAYQLGQYPRWYDRNAFARYNFGQVLGKFVSRIRQFDADAIVGFEGVRAVLGNAWDINLYDGLWRGFNAVPDLDGLAEKVGFIGMGGNEPVSDILRSLLPEKSILLPQRWIHGDDSFDSMATQVWDALTDGCNAIGFCFGEALDESDQKTFVNLQSLKLMPRTELLAEETAVIRMGLGDLLANCDLADDGVAILYSQPSAYAGWADGNSAFGHFGFSHDAWAYGSRELGVGYRYLTEKMVQRGALEKRSWKVLIIPYGIALEDGTVARVRSFVRAGGAVVADLRPAVYSGHCRKLAAGSLDDVFGVTASGGRSATNLSLSGVFAFGGRRVTLNKLDTSAETGLALRGARAGHMSDGTPLLIANHFGKGKTLLLNFHLDAFMKERGELGSDGVRTILSLVYSALDMTPHVSGITTADGKPVRGTEVRIWKDGGGKIISLQKKLPFEWVQADGASINRMFEMHEAVVQLPKPAFVYDIAKGTCLGRIDRFTRTLRDGHAQFFAIMPSPVSVARPGLDRNRLRPGESFSLRLVPERREVTPDTQILPHYVQILNPQGQEVDWGRKVVLSGSGGASVPMRAAYNDMPGKWTIVTTALLGGEQSTVSYEVLPAEVKD